MAKALSSGKGREMGGGPNVSNNMPAWLLANDEAASMRVICATIHSSRPFWLRGSVRFCKNKSPPLPPIYYNLDYGYEDGWFSFSKSIFWNLNAHVSFQLCSSLLGWVKSMQTATSQGSILQLVKSCGLESSQTLWLYLQSNLFDFLGLETNNSWYRESNPSIDAKLSPSLAKILLIFASIVHSKCIASYCSKKRCECGGNDGYSTYNNNQKIPPLFFEVNLVIVRRRKSFHVCFKSSQVSGRVVGAPRETEDHMWGIIMGSRFHLLLPRRARLTNKNWERKEKKFRWCKKAQDVDAPSPPVAFFLSLYAETATNLPGFFLPFFYVKFFPGSGGKENITIYRWSKPAIHLRSCLKRIID